MKTPNFGDAHCGDGALQSQQTLFLDSFWIAASYGKEYRQMSVHATAGKGGMAE